MERYALWRRSLTHALATVAYVFGVALLMNNGEQFFSGAPDVFIAPFILLLFVVSAAITGFLVLGKPIMLYIDGAKHEALMLFAYTIGWLVVLLGALALALTVFFR